MLGIGLIAGCSPERGVMPVEVERLIVAPELVSCVGLAMEQQCLLVRRPGSASPSWTYFYDTIEGFTHTPGYFTEVEVEIFRMSGPPMMDASDRLYRLKRIVKRTPVGPVAFDP
jgi:Domain of unknown function (DUF4377)